jgi:ABC-type oligopeptide transport system substrate-binding subunit
MAKKTTTTTTIQRKVRVSTVPADETKEQKFTRLATARVNKVRKALDQIGLLGGASYVSTDEQRKKIASALKESVEFNLNRLEKVKLSKSTFEL